MVDLDKFWLKVRKTNSCWLWDGPQYSQGYGIFYGPQRYDSLPAHRVAWMLVHGDIPKGLHICHKCDVRLCVNPDHLFIGTPRDNIHDMMAKGRYVCRQSKPAICHPQRKHAARGMCRQCYKAWWKKQ